MKAGAWTNLCLTPKGPWLEVSLSTIKGLLWKWHLCKSFVRGLRREISDDGSRVILQIVHIGRSDQNCWRCLCVCRVVFENDKDCNNETRLLLLMLAIIFIVMMAKWWSRWQHVVTTLTVMTMLNMMMMIITMMMMMVRAAGNKCPPSMNHSSCPNCLFNYTRLRWACGQFFLLLFSLNYHCLRQNGPRLLSPEVKLFH